MDLKGPERTWKDFKELNEVQNLEKCDRETEDRQKTV